MNSGVSVTVNNEIMVNDDFWREVDSKMAVEEDDGKGNVTDEGEIEADWLNDVGFGDLSEQWRQGKSLPENDLGSAVQKLSLKPHQADAVRKRIRTLNATLKKRRKHQRRPPDVRSFFQNEIQENKDSSRSATPDSLDSNEFLDSSPPRRPGSPSILENIVHHTETDDMVCPLPSQVPSFVSVFDHDHTHTYSHSPRTNRELFKQQIRFPVRGSSHAGTDGEIATDEILGIEMLNYHNIGTIYMKGYLHSKKPIQPTREPNPTLNISPTQQTEINTRTYNACPLSSNKNGFTEELTKKNGEYEEEILENTYMDPSGHTRLSDLSEDDVGKVRPILLMELTAQCDHLNIQIRRRKGGKKKSLSEDGCLGIFGISLEQLLAKDRRSTGGNNLLQVPIVFDKLISHLWKRGLDDEGLLRMAGNKTKINDLRATFESSLYSEPEQVDMAMRQCSTHDVANLLKQFIRELPLPLLGIDYIDTFFDVASELKDRHQESCLRLLVLLLPQSHQAVLTMLLEFLRDLVRNSEVNKMSLSNVALILAPNLVPASALNPRHHGKEISRAATWVCLMQTLIRCGSSLFVVPADLLSQMRQINDCARNKKLKGGRERRNFSSKTGGSLPVSAPQLGFPEVLLPVHAGTTAGDVVLFLLEEADRKAESLEKEGRSSSGGGVSSPMSGQVNGNRRRGLPRPDFGKLQGPSLSCLLTQVNRDTTLKSHSLYEVGGNIGYRRVDPLALVPSIVRDNPNAAWVLRCSHRHAVVQ